MQRKTKESANKPTHTRKPARVARGATRGATPDFYQTVADILRAARVNAYRAVNFAMVEAYWNVGRMIVEEEQRGRKRADYGASLLKNLSHRLSQEFGKGFTETNLKFFRQFYLAQLNVFVFQPQSFQPLPDYHYAAVADHVFYIKLCHIGVLR